MEAVIRKWGNDFGIRISNSEAQKMSLKTGYKVYISPLAQEPNYSLESLLSGVTKDNIHKEVSFGKPKGKEAW